jgi:hypothetical protein
MNQASSLEPQHSALLPPRTNVRGTRQGATSEETKVDAEKPFEADVGDEYCVIVDDDSRSNSRRRILTSLVCGERLPPLTSDVHHPLRGYSSAKVVWNSVPLDLERLNDNELWVSQKYLKGVFREPSTSRSYRRVRGSTPFPVCLLLNCNTLDDRLKIVNWWLSLGEKDRDAEWIQLCGRFVSPKKSGRVYVAKEFDFSSSYRTGGSNNKKPKTDTPMMMAPAATAALATMPTTVTTTRPPPPPPNHSPASPHVTQGGGNDKKRRVDTPDDDTIVTKRSRTPQQKIRSKARSARSASAAAKKTTARADGPPPHQDLCPSVEVITRTLQSVYDRIHRENPDRCEIELEKVLLGDNNFRAGILLLREMHQHFGRVHLLDSAKVLLVCRQVRSPTTGTPNDHGCTGFSIRKRLGLRHNTEALCAACKQQRKRNENQLEKESRDRERVDQMRQRIRKLSQRIGTHKRSIRRLQKRLNDGQEKLAEREETMLSEDSDEEDSDDDDEEEVEDDSGVGHSHAPSLGGHQYRYSY